LGQFGDTGTTLLAMSARDLHFKIDAIKKYFESNNLKHSMYISHSLIVFTPEDDSNRIETLGYLF
jgi:hypothetical protein